MSSVPTIFSHDCRIGSCLPWAGKFCVKLRQTSINSSHFRDQLDVTTVSSQPGNRRDTSRKQCCTVSINAVNYITGCHIAGHRNLCNLFHDHNDIFGNCDIFFICIHFSYDLNVLETFEDGIQCETP